MNSFRLIPVVIFASLALFVFKGVGLLTNGGYVLTGAGPAVAAGDGGHGGGGHGGEEATGEDGPALEPAAPEIVLEDASPTLTDSDPTLGEKPAGGHGGAGGHAAPAPGGHGEPAPSGHGETEAAGHDTAPADGAQGHGADASHAMPAAGAEASTACPPAEAHPPAAAGHGGEIPAMVDCPPVGPTNEHGDALPTTVDETGMVKPLDIKESENSEAALLARLGERREQLVLRQGEIDEQLSLLGAAEKRLDDRTKELAAVEAQIGALVNDKQEAEETAFKSVVSMYETMKPKDAAKIFDTLDLSVLYKIASAMSPRKMAPVLAAMSRDPASALTTAFATAGSNIGAATVMVKAEAGQTALPQIVGK